MNIIAQKKVFFQLICYAPHWVQLATAKLILASPEAASAILLPLAESVENDLNVVATAMP